jgi:cytochrome c oxidase assembly factor CtaG
MPCSTPVFLEQLYCSGGRSSQILGALLTFAPRVWYGSYAVTAPWWHLTGLEDQQLGGLIMWIPAGTVLLIVTLIHMARWMRDSDSRWESGRTAALIRETASGSHEL